MAHATPHSNIAPIHGVPLFKLLAKLFPLPPGPLAGQSLQSLRAKYRKWERVNAVEFVFLAAAIVSPLHSALMRYADRIVSFDPTSVYTLRPGPMFWYAPASILSCVMAGFIVRLLNRLLFPDGGREFRAYGDVTAGFRASRMFGCCGLVFMAFGLLLAYFAAATVIHLRQNDIVVHRLWSLEEERYPYSRVHAIREIRDAQRDTNDFEIDFGQAEPWTTRVEVIFFGDAEKTYLSERTGKPIQHFISQ